MTTIYRIADNAQDYKLAHALVKAEAPEQDWPLSFPTLIAVDEDEVVGVFGTNTEQDMILAGPLILKSGKKRTFTLMRLVELYDLTMRECGIKSFVFCAELKNTKWLEYIDNVLGLKPYSYKDGRAWFVRELKG